MKINHYKSFYEVDKPSQRNRYFSKNVKYSEIDWANLASIADAFETRIRDWYIDPAEALKAQTGHFSFSIMAIDCLLIDTLSQFAYGSLSASGDLFKKFVREKLGTDYSRSVQPPIRLDVKQPKRKRGKPRPLQALNDVADVLYHGFRCGVLHQAHIPPYGAVDPGIVPPRIEITGGAVYSDSKASCPCVVISPLHLLNAVEVAFQVYLHELKDHRKRYDKLRCSFKKKFSDCFGVDVSQAAL